MPEYPQDLRPGEYHTEEFRPSVSFSVGKGWGNQCEINLGEAPLGSRGGVGESWEVAMVGGSSLLFSHTKAIPRGPTMCAVNKEEQKTEVQVGNR